MFQAFTGTSRRPRQVNLSGRSIDPFSAASPKRQQPPSSHGPQATLAAAHHERVQRQIERDKQNSTRKIQRVWRGYNARKAVRGVWRLEWDSYEATRVPGLDLTSVPAGIPYLTSLDCVNQLRLLLQFIDTNDKQDVARLAYFTQCFRQTVEGIPSLSTEGGWAILLCRLMKMILNALASPWIYNSSSPFPIDHLPRCLVFLTKLIPRQMAREGRLYYDVMRKLTIHFTTVSANGRLSRNCLIESVVALLQPITSETLDAYEWFARVYLTIPSLQDYLGGLDDLASYVNYKLLASALDAHVLQVPSFQHSVKTDDRLWLLAYFIYFHRHALGDRAMDQAPEALFVKVVSALLGSTATYISLRLDVDDYGDVDPLQDVKPLPSLVKNEIMTLMNQGSITRLLSHVGMNRTTESVMNNTQKQPEDEAKSFANYALTLLRIFPRRGDEIRMWLYLGSASVDNEATTSKIPAIKYFWRATKLSKVFQRVVNDPEGILDMLRDSQGESDHSQLQERQQEWTLVLLFLELYTFLLKVLDDDEFFSGGESFTKFLNGVDAKNVSWTKESALPLAEVEELTMFLKNLAFTLYWNSADLTSTDSDNKSTAMSNYFNYSALQENSKKSVVGETSDLAGVTGIPLLYFKGLVTGLLRMVHERDSRRPFLPDGHWLMTDHFDMAGFIPAVVAEEENRHQLQDEDESEPEDEEIESPLESAPGLVGTGRTQQIRHLEVLRKRQRHVARRRKELEAIAPRLEILRNMPFAIPFNTRVQIFREFIYRDQIRRRKGNVDPDAWRLSMAHNEISIGESGQLMTSGVLSKHHADVRRTNLLEDAFEQFYPLGESLKEPIQITFIDKFDTIEAGIDGGGVTKEFLTSIINDAFKPSGYSSLFAENEQHFLYPNPESVEQEKYELRKAGIVERSPEWNEEIRGLLQRFEFLGRIIGKCLYEGILVDVSFAGFFLLKWALTGGSSSASKESAYRANLNDIQDLDKGLYQGLLQLKNHPGDVEDFALNFTVTDTISVPNGDGTNRTQSITRDLKPDGSNIPVTNQNRLVYISYIARHRLQLQPYLQTNAFLQGLAQIIQPSWLSMFNQGELQRLVGGDAVEIDVSDLRQNTVYSGVYVIGDDQQEHPTIKMFWDVLETMPNKERQKVLKFVTSTPRAPLLGFSHLNPRFGIRDSSSDENRLPSASTCANLLKLPRYTDIHILREKLTYAVNAEAGFDLS